MSPKPYMPGDDIEFINGAGIRKKKGKSGNSSKRTAYFLQQRFPHLETMVNNVQKGAGSKSLKKKPAIEEQQAAAAPLAKVRKKMMQEYRHRLLVQQQEQENTAGKTIQAGDEHH